MGISDKNHQGNLTANLHVTGRPELNVKSHEQFYESLVAQYRDLIHEALLESEEEHKTRVNLGVLNSKLQMIYNAAKYDGLEERIIDDLISEVIPGQQSQAA